MLVREDSPASFSREELESALGIANVTNADAAKCPEEITLLADEVVVFDLDLDSLRDQIRSGSLDACL